LVCIAAGGTNQLKGLCYMRIARISTVSFFVVSQLKAQIEYLEGRGAAVTVISSDGGALREVKAGVVFSRFIPMPIERKMSPLRDLKATWELFLLFRRENFDIVHSTTPKAGLLSSIAARAAGVPVRLHTFTGQAWVEMHGPLRWIARWCDWLIGRLNTRCYADSESQRKFVVSEGVVPPEKLVVIGAGSLAGVDLERFNSSRFPKPARLATKQAMGIPDHVPVLLFVGRITGDKGIRELIQAFGQLKAAGSPAHLVLVGPFDSDSGAGEGVSRSQVDGVPGIHIVGYTDCPEMYMAAADILCLPSYREGFGTVVIEAAAMGLPTIGSDIYGLRDAVVHGETGILVPARNSAALAYALSALLADNDLRARMGRAAKRRAEFLFDANQVNQKLMDEYGMLLQRQIEGA
jgi:glycosyltransferase involved in cell wall biosynthesis